MQTLGELKEKQYSIDPSNRVIFDTEIIFRVPLQQSPRRRPLPGRVGPGGPAAPTAPGIARPNNVPQQAKPNQAYVPPPGQLLKR